MPVTAAPKEIELFWKKLIRKGVEDLSKISENEKIYVKIVWGQRDWWGRRGRCFGQKNNVFSI